MKNLTRYCLLPLILLALSACGGGGGSSSSPNNASGSNNWDEMKWDQDNWR